MGFFSVECDRCHKSILSVYACKQFELPMWLCKAVSIMPDGACYEGIYDGYGRLIDPMTEDPLDPSPHRTAIVVENVCGGPDVGAADQVWHHACWLADGAPLTYKRPSKSASDQGYFVDWDRYARLARPKPAA